MKNKKWMKCYESMKWVKMKNEMRKWKLKILPDGRKMIITITPLLAKSNHFSSGAVIEPINWTTHLNRLIYHPSEAAGLPQAAGSEYWAYCPNSAAGCQDFVVDCQDAVVACRESAGGCLEIADGCLECADGCLASADGCLGFAVVCLGDFGA